MKMATNSKAQFTGLESGGVHSLKGNQAGAQY